MSNLPHDFTHQPPKGYYYTTTVFKRNTIAIYLNTKHKFVYNGGNPASTIWGFYNTKERKYYAPINATKQGNQVELCNTTPYTSMPLLLNPLEHVLYT